MLVKSFEVDKVNLDKNKIILMHGKNDGLKNEIINLLTKNNKEISKYDEKEIIDNEIFKETLKSRENRVKAGEIFDLLRKKYRNRNEYLHTYIM